MKIKLALLDSDQNYLNRIVTAFNIKYPSGHGGNQGLP